MAQAGTATRRVHDLPRNLNKREKKPLRKDGGGTMYSQWNTGAAACQFRTPPLTGMGFVKREEGDLLKI